MHSFIEDDNGTTRLTDQDQNVYNEKGLSLFYTGNFVVQYTNFYIRHN